MLQVLAIRAKHIGDGIGAGVDVRRSSRAFGKRLSYLGQNLSGRSRIAASSSVERARLSCFPKEILRFRRAVRVALECE